MNKQGFGMDMMDMIRKIKFLGCQNQDPSRRAREEKAEIERLNEVPWVAFG